MKFRIEHVISGIDVPHFETLFFDEAFNIALCQKLKLGRTLISRTEKDGRLHREARIAPDREIPAPVAKVLGASKAEYTEIIDCTLGSGQATWKTISSVLTDKVDSSGTMQFVARGNGVARIIEGEVKVKVFGIGGVVERFIVSDVENSYNQAAEFMQAYLKDHPQS